MGWHVRVFSEDLPISHLQSILFFYSQVYYVRFEGQRKSHQVYVRVGLLRLRKIDVCQCLSEDTKETPQRLSRH